MENNLSIAKKNRVFKKLESENETQYLWRLGKKKINGGFELSWEELKDIFNKNLDKDLGESAYRKPIQRWYEFVQKVGIDTNEDFLKEHRRLKREIYATKLELKDEAREYRKLIREETRFKNLFKYLDSYIKSKKYSSYDNIKYEENNKHLIVNISDIHLGSKYVTKLGKFNIEICKNMFEIYLNKLINKIKKHKIRNLTVNLLGDLIEGELHTSSQVSNNKSVLRQVIDASDLIINFISKLSKLVNNVNVYSVKGNHDRIARDKREDLPEHNFSLITEHMLDKQFEESDKVNIHLSNEKNLLIKEYNINNKNIIIKHGHNLRKNLEKNIEKVNNMYKKHIDCIIVGHFHAVKMCTMNDTTIFVNGSFKTGGRYAEKLGVYGTPKQTAIYLDKNNIDFFIFSLDK